MNKTMEKALNNQIAEEFYSAYLYLAMAAHCENIGLKGFANWFRVQNQEEMFHFTKFFNFVLSRGGAVKLQAINEPPASWKSPKDLFEQTLKHEQHITACINKLVDQARAENDNASFNFLQWFVGEQVEEEDNVNTLLAKLKLAGDNPASLFMIDQELAARVFTPPAAAAE
jgi:ferritin